MQEQLSTLDQVADAWKRMYGGVHVVDLTSNHVKAMLAEVVRIAPPIARTRTSWSEEKCEALIRAKHAGTPSKDISTQIGATVSALDKQYSLLKNDTSWTWLFAELEGWTPACNGTALLSPETAPERKVDENSTSLESKESRFWNAERDREMARLRGKGLSWKKVGQRVGTSGGACSVRWATVKRDEPERFAELLEEERKSAESVPKADSATEETATRIPVAAKQQTPVAATARKTSAEKPKPAPVIIKDLEVTWNDEKIEQLVRMRAAGDVYQTIEAAIGIPVHALAIKWAKVRTELRWRQLIAECEEAASKQKAAQK